MTTYQTVRCRIVQDDEDDEEEEDEGTFVTIDCYVNLILPRSNIAHDLFLPSAQKNQQTTTTMMSKLVSHHVKERTSPVILYLESNYSNSFISFELEPLLAQTTQCMFRSSLLPISASILSTHKMFL